MIGIDPIKIRNRRRFRRGAYLPLILLVSALFLAYGVALAKLSFSNTKITDLHNKKITSMSLAEAGVNYYVWHLAHNNSDYCDGVLDDADPGNDSKCPAPAGPGENGPFSRDYKDAEGRVLGTYTLHITPPGSGGTVATVRSTGKVAGFGPRRTIVAKVGKPSLAKYTLLVNGTQYWHQSGQRINGNVFINNSGIRNDGEITGDTYSTEETYDSWWGQSPGVWGEGIFGGIREFPTTPIDFADVDAKMAVIYGNARDNGVGQYYDPSGEDGYHLVLRENDYELYVVNSSDNSTLDIGKQADGLPDQSPLGVGVFNYPDQGVIVFSDDVWVEGQVRDKKLTILAADYNVRGAGRRKNIMIPADISYAYTDGRDKIGLLAQQNILVTAGADSDLEINAAMIAQSGEIKINPYGVIKERIKIYGSMAHNTGMAWTYTSPMGEVVSGFRTVELIIDNSNITYPPPFFPVTDSYQILSWREE